MDDDFEVEVTDLRSGRSSRHVIENNSQPDIEHGDSEAVADAADDSFERTNLDGRPEHGRAALSLPQRRRRQISGLAAGCALLLAIVVAFASTPNSNVAIRALLNIPTATPTTSLAPGEDVLILSNGVPWGQVAVDGKPVQVTVISQGQGSAISLSRGKHALQYVAAPFARLLCTISVPKSDLDTCPLTPTPTYGGLPPDIRIVNLGDEPENLPTRPLAALKSAIAHVIGNPSAPLTIEPGDHYIDANGVPHVARERMLAQQILALATYDQPQYTPYSLQTCHTLCQDFSNNPSIWSVQALVMLNWRYMTVSGEVFPSVAHAYVNPQTSILPSVGVNVQWDAKASSWRVTAESDISSTGPTYSANISCTMLSDIQNQLAHLSNGPLSLATIRPPDETEGCAERVHFGLASEGGLPAAPPNPSDALFLYRLGVLTAVNQQAAVAAPGIPRASSHEAALVAQWDAQISAAGDPIGTPSTGSAGGGAPAR